MRLFPAFAGRARRRLLATVTIAAAAAATAVAHAAVIPARAAGTPACATGGLVAWLDDGNAGLGSQFYSVNFTNLSGHTCTLRGFSGVSAVNLKHKQLGRAASRVGGTTVSIVTLRNGQSATAKLRIVAAQNFPRAGAVPLRLPGSVSFRPTGPGRW